MSLERLLKSSLRLVLLGNKLKRFIFNAETLPLARTICKLKCKIIPKNPLTLFTLFVQTVNAIPGRNRTVLNFAYHLPKP